MDIPDILVVAQHGVPELEKANTQRAGRAVRDRSLQGTFLLFTEPKYDVGGYPSKRKKKGKAAKRKAADHAAGPPIKKRGMRDDKRPAGLQDDDDDDVQVKEEEMEVELGEDVEEDEAEDGGEDMEGNANPDDDGDGEGIEQSQRQTYGRKRGQKKPARRVDQTLVDLVETDGCRRKIQDEHYGNNNLRKLPLACLLFITDDILFQQLPNPAATDVTQPPPLRTVVHVITASQNSRPALYINQSHSPSNVLQCGSSTRPRMINTTPC